jgi:Tol biopolymer transport system component
MKRFFMLAIIVVAVGFGLALVVWNGAAAQSAHPYATKDKLGEPKLFADGIINTKGDDYGPTFTPDGKTLYFVRRRDRRNDEYIAVSDFKNGNWTQPAIVSFSGQHPDKEPFVSPDGKSLFFASRRPLSGAGALKDWDIWMVSKTKTGWSEPQNLGPTVNSSGYDNYPSVAKNGTLYFGSVREGGKGTNDLYRSRLVNGKYAQAESLGEIINTAGNEADPYIAPDESYLIFSGELPGGLGEGDLYISFNRGGAWTKPESLGPIINSATYEYTPLISPDGKYLFFSRGWGDIYQIDAGPLNLRRK